MIKVLIVNTYENTGGAAVAAGRLLAALNANGVEAKMVVAEKTTENPAVVTPEGRLRKRWHFLWERLVVFMHQHLKKEHLWEIDIANVGSDITQMKEFQEADVIHLSWINQGMLSLDVIRRILQSGKAVVWTMHDLWPLSAICHYARGCEAYHSGCRHCKLLPHGGSDYDLSTSVWNKKKALYKGSNIHFVTCSEWLGRQAKMSGLLQDCHLTSVPNPIDSQLFCKEDKAALRERRGVPADRKLILFAAQKVTDERKGAGHFIRGMKALCDKHPEWKDRLAVALLGGHSEELVPEIPFATYPLGYVSGERALADVYAMADVFVLPSMEDNLPNTIMEAMACGVPCVGFEVGGIPEMIDHKVNGYVAHLGDADDLADGIAWVLDDVRSEALSEAALEKVRVSYSQKSVAGKYSAVYMDALKLMEK